MECYNMFSRKKKQTKNKQTNKQQQQKTTNKQTKKKQHHTFVVYCYCVEVLRPSQPNGVISSAESLPNHTFTGQA